jgi:hypothetical protein
MASQRHQVPTHLNVEDRLVLGLTARQFLYLLSGVAVGYGAWDAHAWLAFEPRLALALTALLAGAALALVRPAGRGLDQWLLVVFQFLFAPRRCAWRIPEPDPAAWRAREAAWADIAPRVAWSREGRR